MIALITLPKGRRRARSHGAANAEFVDHSFEGHVAVECILNIVFIVGWLFSFQLFLANADQSITQCLSVINESLKLSLKGVASIFTHFAKGLIQDESKDTEVVEPS